jgi:hypothetical protein
MSNLEGALTGGLQVTKEIIVELEGEEHTKAESRVGAIDWKVTKTDLGLQAT